MKNIKLRGVSENCGHFDFTPMDLEIDFHKVPLYKFDSIHRMELIEDSKSKLCPISRFCNNLPNCPFDDIDFKDC